ncbi:glycosyltransferase [candidate division KSB1 bacterium]|nr:glycosyltransferase [candidate division KSB1 bacterium]
MQNGLDTIEQQDHFSVNQSLQEKSKGFPLIVLITNIPTPYRIPLFKKLYERCRKCDLGFHVIFAAAGYRRRQWEIPFQEMNFPYTILKSTKISLSHERVCFSYAGILQRISELKPDLIITSGFSLASTWIALQSIPFLIWSESIHRASHKWTIFRRWQRQFITRRAKGFLVSGERAGRYLQSLGANKEKIVQAISTVDTDRFYPLSKIRKIRSHNPEHPFTLLYVGHLTTGKRVDRLLHIMHQWVQVCPQAQLLLVGQGIEEISLRQLCTQMGLDENVKFLGFLQHDQLLTVYAQADVFVFPSQYDVWGMVLIEAMASGLTCLASKQAGATSEVIQHKMNGFKVDFDNPKEIIQYLNDLYQNPGENIAIGNKAAHYIQTRCHLENSIDGFMKAILWFTR